MSHSLLDTPSVASPDGVKSMKRKTSSPRGISPSKRGQLMNMSPNVSKKTVQLNITTPRGGTIQSRESRLSSRPQSRLQSRPQGGQSLLQGGQNSLQSRVQTSAQTQSSHPQTHSQPHSQPHPQTQSQPHPQKPISRPILKKPMSLYRSQTSIAPKSLSSSLSLRRTNSFNEASANSSNQTDRFIPSSHNSVTKKLDINHTTPHPNASPHTHIKAQSSKIYQKHVAEACGLDTTSRILQFQPLPPERKKPVNLFSSVAKNNATTTSNPLNPTLAFARAKKIPSAPERVLDAPGLVDDFYLNLLTWSLNNLLAIGLEDTVYVWNASTGSVGLLCELANKASVTSLRWSDDGSYISIGRDDGFIEIWDIETNTKLRTLNCDNHLTRIASQAWNQHILTSGSRFGTIYHSDVRIPQHFTSKLDRGHVAEVCGLEYKPDGSQFASGGNDNLVCIWDVRQTNNNQQPLFSKNNHKAAVKSLLWCPYQLNLLVTGGGSCDKTINFWNTATGARVNTIETESQISSLNWGYSSGTGMEVVATHGFPNNNISLFHYPTLQKTGDINQAHDSRILSGCLSPDSLTLATVAGDENLKFWSLFDLKGQKEEIEEIDDTKRIKKMMNLR